MTQKLRRMFYSRVCLRTWDSFHQCIVNGTATGKMMREIGKTSKTLEHSSNTTAAMSARHTKLRKHKIRKSKQRVLMRNFKRECDTTDTCGECRKEALFEDHPPQQRLKAKLKRRFRRV